MVAVVLTGPESSIAKLNPTDAVERSRVVGDPYDRYVRDADGTIWKGDGTTQPSLFNPGSVSTDTFVDKTTEQDITVRKNFRGASRGVGSGDYLTQIGGAWPAIVTNAMVTINGAIGDPVPTVIAGEGNYMLGISSDVGDFPVIVVRAQSGPALRFYDAGPTLVYEVIAAGMVYARPGVSDGGGNLPAYSFIANRHTGMDMTGADNIVFYSAASEKARVTSSGMTVTGDFITTQKIQTGDVGIDIHFKWLLYSPDGNVYMRDQTNARMHTTWFQGVSNTNAQTWLHSCLRVDGNVGFYGTDPVAKPTGVPVTAAGIHAALVTLGLIAA